MSSMVFVLVGERKCVLCNHFYRDCCCRCTWCGEKLWTFYKSEWHHHVCGGKDMAAARVWREGEQ